jgi:hypothetical protein
MTTAAACYVRNAANYKNRNDLVVQEDKDSFKKRECVVFSVKGRSLHAKERRNTRARPGKASASEEEGKRRSAQEEKACQT